MDLEGSSETMIYLPELHDLALREGLGAQLCIGLVLPEAQIIGGHNEPVAIHHLCKPDGGEDICNVHEFQLIFAPLRMTGVLLRHCMWSHLLPVMRKDCCVQHRAIYGWYRHLSQGFWLVLKAPFWSAKGEVIILVCLAGIAEGADFVCVAAHHGGVFSQSKTQI